MKSFLLLYLLFGCTRCDDHPDTEETAGHSTTSIAANPSTTSISIASHYSETSHTSRDYTSAHTSTSTNHLDEDHTSASSIHYPESEHSAPTSTTGTNHHPETDHSSSIYNSTHYSKSNDFTSAFVTSFATGVVTVTGKPSTGVICERSTPPVTPITTNFYPILSAHSTHMGMMRMTGFDSPCPDWADSDFRYMMNGIDSNHMCCTFSATLTQVGSLLGCCPCGSRCTGNLPQAHNWYTRAGQVVLTTGSVPASAASTTREGSSSSGSLDWESLMNWPLTIGSIMFTLLLIVQVL